MRQENAYGVIPLQIRKSDWQVLLVQHHSGHWAFPKGHADVEETPKQTAERELREETGLTIQKFFPLKPLTENYCFYFQGQKISKTVQYFLALVHGQVKIQDSEIRASQWLSLPLAFEQITFYESKRMCLQAREILKLFVE